MKKIVIFVLLTIIMVMCSFGSTFASSNSDLVQRSTKYFETTITDQGIVKKEIKKAEAETKIKFKEDFKKLDKKIKNNDPDLDSADFTLSVVSALIFIDDGGGGGGTSDTTLIVYPQTGTENTTTVNCNLSTYTFCQGIASTIGTITKLETSVSMNPNLNTGMHVTNTLTWYDSPVYSYTDFMAIGIDGYYLDLSLASIKATTQVHYNWNEWYYDPIYQVDLLKSGSGYKTNTFYYSGVDKIINFTTNSTGLIWNIVDVYQDYIYDHSLPAFQTISSPILRDKTDNTHHLEVEVTKVVYTLNVDLNLKVLNKYSDLNSTIVWGDYQHSVFYITVLGWDSINLGAKISGTEVSLSFLAVSITPTIKPDGSRKNDIQFLF